MRQIAYITLLLSNLATEAWALNIEDLAVKIFNADFELSQQPIYKRQQSCFYAGYTHAALNAIKEVQVQSEVTKKAEKKINQAIEKTDVQIKKCYSESMKIISFTNEAKRVEIKIEKANKKLNQALDGLDSDVEIFFDEVKLKKQLLAAAKKLPYYSSVDVGLFWSGTWKPHVCFDIGTIKFQAELAALNAKNESAHIKHILTNSIKELQSEICFSRRWTEKYRQERAELIYHLEKYVQE